MDSYEPETRTVQFFRIGSILRIIYPVTFPPEEMSQALFVTNVLCHCGPGFADRVIEETAGDLCNPGHLVNYIGKENVSSSYFRWFKTLESAFDYQGPLFCRPIEAARAHPDDLRVCEGFDIRLFPAALNYDGEQMAYMYLDRLICWLLENMPNVLPEELGAFYGLSEKEALFQETFGLKRAPLSMYNPSMFRAALRGSDHRVST
jgi:hypothetical protein